MTSGAGQRIPFFGKVWKERFPKSFTQMWMEFVGSKFCRIYFQIKANTSKSLKYEPGLRGKLFPREFPREMHFHFPPAGGKCVFTGNGKSFESFFMCKIMGNSILTYVELRIFKFGKGIQKILIQNL